MAVSSCNGFSCKIDGSVSLIEDEKFDFDVPISPNVCDAREANNNLEDEDEVFFGPVGHKERCVTANSGLQDDDNCKPMSPLNGEQIAELFKEATAVSLFIKSQSLSKNSYQSEENEDVCSVLSETFIVVDDQNYGNVAEVPDQENNLSFPAKSEFSPEMISEDNLSQSKYSSSVVIPTTPPRILRESNYLAHSDVILPSPFKAREARPLANASKFRNSKLPQTQMTLKTRSCFNSPIKAEHVYGMMPEPAIENDKLRVPSQSGLKPPGFAVQPRRRRRTSSTSSSSSISSALSKSNPDLNETFTVLDTSASDPSLIPSACTRKVPATKASLKPLRRSSVLPKKASSVSKPKGKLQPVKALPQPGNVGVKKAPQISRSLGSTPGKQQGSQSSDKKLVRARTPVAVQRSKSFTTPVKTRFGHQKSSLESEQLNVCHDQTPNAALRSKSFTTPNSKNGNGISTAQPNKCAQNLTKEGNPEQIATPRKRGSAKETPRKSLTAVPTPLRRRGSAVDSSATCKTEVTQVQTRSTDVPRPSTPTGGSSESKIVITPPNEVPSSVIKRKSLSVGGQKRRSLLPTPVRINKTTRSHSQKLKPSIKAFGSQGALSLNISPPAERVVSRIAGVLSDSQLNAKVEPLKSTSSLADPFSPVTHMIPTHPERDNFVSRDSHNTNLIQLSPSLPSEGNLIDL